MEIFLLVLLIMLFVVIIKCIGIPNNKKSEIIDKKEINIDIELLDGWLVFCNGNGMYYWKLNNTYKPLISERNHKIMLEKYGVERTLLIVNANVRAQLYSLYDGNSEKIKCKNIPLSVLNK